MRFEFITSATSTTITNPNPIISKIRAVAVPRNDGTNRYNLWIDIYKAIATTGTYLSTWTRINCCTEKTYFPSTSTPYAQIVPGTLNPDEVSVCMADNVPHNLGNYSLNGIGDSTITGAIFNDRYKIGYNFRFSSSIDFIVVKLKMMGGGYSYKIHYDSFPYQTPNSAIDSDIIVYPYNGTLNTRVLVNRFKDVSDGLRFYLSQNGEFFFVCLPTYQYYATGFRCSVCTDFEATPIKDLVYLLNGFSEANMLALDNLDANSCITTLIQKYNLDIVDKSSNERIADIGVHTINGTYTAADGLNEEITNITNKYHLLTANAVTFDSYTGFNINIICSITAYNKVHLSFNADYTGTIKIFYTCKAL